MPLTWEEIDEGIQDAKRTIFRYKLKIKSMAALVSGNLRPGGVGDYDLCRLKKELKNYNMHTGRWMD